VKAPTMMPVLFVTHQLLHREKGCAPQKDNEALLLTATQ
jgi:hypothetical protein